MLKTLPLVLGFLVGAAGCKSDASSTAKPASSGASATDGSAGAQGGRSARVPFKPMAARPAGIMRETGDLGEREARRAERMKQFDKDGDGAISDEERDAARADRAQEMLDRLDTDKDGTVSEAERVAAQADRAANLRTRLDADGDGKLTVSEMESSRFARLDPATIDTNKDGVISTEELAAGMPARPQFGTTRPQIMDQQGTPGTPVAPGAKPTPAP